MEKDKKNKRNFFYSIFNKIFKANKKEVIKHREELEIKKDNHMGINEAINFIQEKFMNYNKLSLERKQTLQSFAMSGDKVSRKHLIDCFVDIINEENVRVEGFTVDEIAKSVFNNHYGLKNLQKYYDDITVDEIRVNSKNNIRIVSKGIPVNIEETLESDRDIENMIKRMIMEDIGVSLDRSNPVIESVLKDGSRLTAVCYPISKSWSFIIRKHDSFEPMLKNYIETETFDEFVWERLSLLARGGAKILFSGNVGSGKTTLMKRLIGELDKSLRIGVIGSDLELKLQEYYPDRDIVEFEEQPHIGITMKELFSTMLRQSIDALVIEEFRGSGEAIEAVRACTRGMPNAFTTAHFNNPEEAIEGTALFMLEEGLNLTLDLAKLRVARAFNVVVQLFGDSITGKKKLISVTEIGVDENNEVYFNELIKWVPDSDNYFGSGKWMSINQPSAYMIKRLLTRVGREEVEELGWDTSMIKL